MNKVCCGTLPCTPRQVLSSNDYTPGVDSLTVLNCIPCHLSWHTVMSREQLAPAHKMHPFFLLSDLVFKMTLLSTHLNF